MTTGDVDSAALDRLANDLHVFGAAVHEALQTTARNVVVTEQLIEKRRQYWNAELHRREAELARAERALAACERSGGPDDPPPSCGAEERDVWRAQEAVDEAVLALRQIAAMGKAVQEACAKYEPSAREMNQAATDGVARAKRELAVNISRISDYEGGVAAGIASLLETGIVGANRILANMPEPVSQGLSSTADSIAPGTGAAFDAVQVTAQIEQWRKDADPAASEALRRLPEDLFDKASEATRDATDAVEHLIDELLEQDEQ